MFSSTVEYALRAVMCLAKRKETRLTTPEIAEEAQVPAGYLAKVLQALARAGIVDSRRGLGGGFVLVREPEELALIEVIDAVDPIKRLDGCPLKLKTHSGGLCPLHRRLDYAIQTVREVFETATVADIMEEGLAAGLISLGGFPCAETVDGKAR